MIEIIPAIDIIDGKCVRLSEGDFEQLKAYPRDPVAIAKDYEKKGFRRLHVVDLDAARHGKMVNKKILRRICTETNLIVDYGGGIKTDADVAEAFSLGAKMITGGSVAVKNKELFESWIKQYGPDRIILGADVRDEMIAVSGWKETTGLNIFDFISYYAEKGISNVICTDISRDGMLTGPSIALYLKLMKHFPDIEIIASGGVGKVSDIDELNRAGIRSVIAGKAFYEKKIPLKPYPLQTLAGRIIPCLDIKNGRVVKGTNFVGLKDAGDPLELAKRYSDEGADELVFLDITASHEKRKTLQELVRRVAMNVNIPFTVGGGITSVEDVNALLGNGADKVSVNSAAVRNPEIINRMSERFGNQCIVLAVDARQEEDGWIVYLNGGRIPTGIELFGWIREAVERGAGEILFTSMDHDGTRNGFANEALARISSEVNVPVIASGGAGELEHFRDGFTIGKADAVLAAGVFHYGRFSIREVKEYLEGQNIKVRNY